MKKITLLVTCLIALQIGVFAGVDKTITVDQLPEKARQFIKTHFEGLDVSFAKMEQELLDKSYEVFFVNGNKIEFDKAGEWTEINCKFSEIPVQAIPKQIQSYVIQNHQKFKVVEIEKDKRDYEVKLNNGLELKFDSKFNFMYYDN
ncbi:PepSY-like domain-containing protein [Odoribacter sp. OttesenSCG-928-J03]|nr:PepSY-like domain-containing protein [Odoribacter sp. OttesenSCG-928-J03]MDL2283242.1 PepSY-like domain-containing protein [Odoribacter sp. OttesenSCG-928-G04]